MKTETKKWVITSVVDPRTQKKISFDDALLERVLDQENGKYCNPETGEEMSIGVAIERNLIQVLQKRHVISITPPTPRY